MIAKRRSDGTTGRAGSRAPRARAADPPARTLALAGDVMLGRLVDGGIAHHGFRYPWGDLLPVLRRADLFLANLECALTRPVGDDRALQSFYLRARPCAVEALRQARVDFVALANDHALDSGLEGLAETLAVLDRAGIAHAGAGPDLAAARAPAVLDAGGLRVAVVACADSRPEWAATAESAGICYVPVPPKATAAAEAAAAVAEARRRADLCVLSMHWGMNMRDRPPREFRDFARRMIDAGADLFWGHSAHLVQGVEWYRGRLILYDTGDFVDDYAADAGLRNDLSGLFLVSVGPRGVTGLRVLPVAIAESRVNRAAGPDRAWFVRRLERLCGELGSGVADDGRVVRVRPAAGVAAAITG